MSNIYLNCFKRKKLLYNVILGNKQNNNNNNIVKLESKTYQLENENIVTSPKWQFLFKLGL